MGEAVMDVGRRTTMGRPGRPSAHERRLPGNGGSSAHDRRFPGNGGSSAHDRRFPGHAARTVL
ncbi:hypothetical protein [Microbispora hainanensis]|uniref:Uncharacterized protein n=1 Tax=Microbispora hainanensis TaxID=568844 RepID=A0ABZ1T3G6_9ACTN|nr:hypothetical protein [Microbispora hainanensis]